MLIPGIRTRVEQGDDLVGDVVDRGEIRPLVKIAERTSVMPGKLTGMDLNGSIR